jgi:hypothetical protein
MLVIAHIGNIPVEEYAGFWVPILLLCGYGWNWNKRRRRAVARLPGPAAPLPEATVAFVLAQWADGGHRDAGAELLPLLYPPGPEGVSAAELAQRVSADLASVTSRLEDLADLGYVEYDAAQPAQPIGVTAEGIDLLNITEDALLIAHDDPARVSAEAGLR